MTDTRDESLGEAGSLADRTGDQVAKVLERILAAAQPGAVFGQPVDAGSYTVITASEVTSGGGFGAGRARGPGSKPGASQPEPAEAARPGGKRPIGGSGFGGGGGSTGRPVAVIAIGQNGVTVRPVVDVTKVVLTALTVSSALLAMRRAMRRARKAGAT
jgi:uncharacterized spore protein YtfJ